MSFGSFSLRELTCMHCVYLALWTRKVLCGSFLCAIYKFSFIHSFKIGHVLQFGEIAHKSMPYCVVCTENVYYVHALCTWNISCVKRKCVMCTQEIYDVCTWNVYAGANITIVMNLLSFIQLQLLHCESIEMYVQEMYMCTGNECCMCSKCRCVCMRYVCAWNIEKMYGVYRGTVWDVLGKFICVYRSTTTDEDLGELTKTHNPEEIDIDDDSDDDENVEGECYMYKRHIIFCIFWYIVCKLSSEGVIAVPTSKAYP